MAWSLANLKTAIDEYTQNTYWGVTDQKDNFIRLSEERINNLVQIDSYNTSISVGDLSDGTSKVTIPDGSNSPISAVYFKVRGGETQTSNPWNFLLLKDYDFLNEYAPKDGTKATPKYYSFYSNASLSNRPGTFAIGPTSDGAYDYEVSYFFNPGSLVDNVTTWLGNHAENALLYACLLEAYTYLKGEADLLQLYELRFRESVEALVATEGGVFRNKPRLAKPPAVIPQ